MGWTFANVLHFGKFYLSVQKYEDKLVQKQNTIVLF